MRNLITFATLALVACGYSEDKYAEDLATKLCDMVLECTGEPCPETATGTTGTTGTTATVPDDCEFDGAAAKECIDAEWTCSEEVAGFSFPVPADVCANVYVCGETTGSEATGT